MKSKIFFLLAGAMLFMLACSALFPARENTGAPQTPSTEENSAPTGEATLPVEVKDLQEGASGLGDSLYPNFGNGGYDVQSYLIDIEVLDVKNNKLSAVTTIEAKATQNLSSFNLDFIGFKITQLSVNDAEADFSRSGQELRVTPASPLSNGQGFTVRVAYKGTPEEFDSIAIPVQTGWVAFDGGIFVLSEPDGAATFYPVNDHPLDKARFTFRITVPKPYEVAANGVLKETTDNGDTTTYLFTMRDEMASYLATVNIGDFNIETMQSPSGIPIRNYYAANLPKGINKPFARQGEMLEYFSGVFGEYPFEVYGSLVMDTSFGAALENQTMSIFGVDMIDIDRVKHTESVVAHELAHQWFGDDLSVADWGDIWLNEGFATYAEGLWLEHLHGRGRMDQYMSNLYYEAESAPEYFPAPGNPPADNLFNGGVYYRGGLTLHALRFKVGDDAFFKIIKTYYQTYRGGNARTEDFIKIAEEISGQDLREFFDAWLYQDALMPIPELDLGK